MIITPQDASKRLRSARIAAGFKTAAAAAKAVGFNAVTVRAHESGQNGLTAERADKYASVYGVSAQYIVFGVRGEGDDVGPEDAAYAELALRAAKAEASVARVKDTLRRLLESLA